MTERHARHHSPAASARTWPLLPAILVLVVAAAAGPLLWPVSSSATSAALSVTDASLQVSSFSAGATGVSMSVTFRVTTALPATTGSIVLVFPSGTSLPSGCSYSVTNDATLATGCATAAVTGTSALVPVPAGVGTVGAGDMVSLVVHGVTNPSPGGAEVLVLSTSVDLSPVSLAYQVSGPRSVTNASLQVSSTSVGATGATYSVTFSSPDRLLYQTSVITLSDPTGSLFPNGTSAATCQLDDDSIGESVNCSIASSGTQSIDVVSALTTNPGDTISLIVNGATNASATGAVQLQLATSADPSPVSLAYTLRPAAPVRDLSLRLSSYRAGSKDVTWSIGLVMPDRFGNSAANRVTIAAPPGTAFPAGGYTIADAQSAIGSNCCSGGTESGSSLSIAIPPTNPGDMVFIVIPGVTNPPTMTRLAISTTADPRPVFVSLGRAVSPRPSVQLSSASASATAVEYSTTFVVTSSTSAATDFKLSSPGATFPIGADYELYDDTTGSTSNAGPVAGSIAGPSVTLTAQLAARPGDEVTVVARSVDNASTAGGHTFSVSSPAGGGSAGFALTAPAAVSSPILTLSSPSALATEATYAVTFSTTDGLRAKESSVILRAQPGTTFPTASFSSGSNFLFLNDTIGVETSAYAVSAVGSTLTVTPSTGSGFFAAPGDVVTLAVYDVGNPSASSTATMSIATSSDPLAIASPYAIGPTSSVSSATVQLSSFAPGATGVAYSITFRLTTGEEDVSTTDYSSVRLTLPAGTVLPTAGSGDYHVENDTLDSATGGSFGYGGVTLSGTTATITADNVSSGDVITVLITGVTNPTSAGGVTVLVSTTSDTGAAGIGYLLGAAAPPSGTRPSTIATSLPTPRQALLPLGSLAVNGGIAAAVAMLLTFPSQIFNQTFQDNYADITEWYRRRLRRLRGGRSRPDGDGEMGDDGHTAAGAGAAAGVGAESGEPEHPAPAVAITGSAGTPPAAAGADGMPIAAAGTPVAAAGGAVAVAAIEEEGDAAESERLAIHRRSVFVIVIVAGALVNCFNDEHFGLTTASLVTFVSVLLAILVGVGVSALVAGAYHARRHGGSPRRLVALPAGIAIAIAFVLFSRVIDFEPGYLYGIVCGVLFTRELADNEKGHLAALGVLTTMTLSVLAWIAWVPVNAAATRSGASIAVVLLDDLLAAIFVSGLVGSFFGMIPIKGLPGWTVKRWSVWAWVCGFALALMGLFQILLRPGVVGHGHRPLVTSVVLFLAFGAASIVFHEHFENKERRARGDDAPSWRERLRTIASDARGGPATRQAPESPASPEEAAVAVAAEPG